METSELFPFPEGREGGAMGRAMGGSTVCLFVHGLCVCSIGPGATGDNSIAGGPSHKVFRGEH